MAQAGLSPAGLQGLEEFEQVLAGFTDKIRRRVLAAAFRKALEPVQQALIAAAPENKAKAPRAGWRPGRQPGRLKQSIKIALVRKGSIANSGDARVIVYVKRQAKRGGIAGPQGLWLEYGTEARTLKKWKPKPDRFGRVRRRGWQQPARGAVKARPWFWRAASGPVAAAEQAVVATLTREVDRALTKRTA